MTDYTHELDATLKEAGLIPRNTVLHWIDGAADLRTMAKLYRLTDEAYYRIQPDLGMEVTCLLIRRYLLQCIRENVQNDEEILSRFDAAMDMHGWLRHLVSMEGTEKIIGDAAAAITELFLSGREDVRYTLETGFLEHALETEALRPYFEHWAVDPVLRAAWEPALAWGKAHPDFMARLIDGKHG